MIIGVTGPIGAGKSYVTRLFKKKGIPTVDADKVYHSLTDKKTELTLKLADVFGAMILNADGSLNRKALSDIVFGDPQKLSLLNSLTHGHVLEKIKSMVTANEKKGYVATVVEVPLMFESGFDKCCDEIVCVVADEDVRVKRIMKRNGFTEEEAKKRVKNQKNNKFYIENSTKVVYNSSYKCARQDFERIFTEIFG